MAPTLVGASDILKALYPQGNVRDFRKEGRDMLLDLEFRIFMANWWEKHKNSQPYEYWSRIRSLAYRRMRLPSVAKRKATIGLIEAHKFPYHFTSEGL